MPHYSADEIHIAGLSVNARLGVTETERARVQEVRLFLTLRPVGGFAAISDRLEGTIDYAAVCETVRQVASSHPRCLIETLALDIAAGILRAYPSCAAVDVELRKFILPGTDYVSARLSRHRP